MRGGAGIIHTARKTLLITFVSVVVLDLLTKALITGGLREGQAVEIVPGFLNIVYYMNPGAAFGLFNEGGFLRRAFLVATSVAALAVIGFLLRSAKGFLTSFGLSLVAAGAVGNLIDRVRYGTVVDFIDLHIGGYHWPAFNVADSAITVGVILAVFSYYFKDASKNCSFP